MRRLMDRTCSGSGLTIGCQPKYPTEVSSTCVRAYFRGVLRIAMELAWPYRCGATGESLDRSRSWEGADATCRDQRTRRWSHARGARNEKLESLQDNEHCEPLG